VVALVRAVAVVPVNARSGYTTLPECSDCSESYYFWNAHLLGVQCSSHSYNENGSEKALGLSEQDRLTPSIIDNSAPYENLAASNP
jgi:hypothetical protein